MVAAVGDAVVNAGGVAEGKERGKVEEDSIRVSVVANIDLYCCEFATVTPLVVRTLAKTRMVVQSWRDYVCQCGE
jgi:hypothetical protein